MERTRELEEQVRRLARMVEEMRTRMSQLEAKPAEPERTTHSRRQLLKLGGAAALGAVGSAALRVMPAAAADGASMHVGQPHTAESPTTIADDSIPGTAVPLLGLTAKGFNSTAYGNFNETFVGALQVFGTDGGTTTPVDGFDAFASGAAAFAVYGLTDTGTGVTGESGSGIGVYARGTGRLRQDGLPTAGKPSYAPNNFEQVRDAKGVLWTHDDVGNWRRMNTVRVDTVSASGPFKPFRRLDTRLAGGARPANQMSAPIQVAGTGSGASTIPGNAIAVIGNLTATGYSGNGFLTIMPAGVAYNPNTDPSSLNFIPGQFAIANSFTCGLDGLGRLQVYVGLVSSDYIIDITAYIQ